MPITTLLALGSNSSGQLGIGNTVDTATPTRCSFAGDGLQPNESIDSLAGGGNHTLILTSKYRMFAAGSNESGRCALPPDLARATTNSFKLVEFWETGPAGALFAAAKVTQIAATWEASFFVVDWQRVYACGRGVKGELGAGEGREELLEPELILDLGSQGEDVVVTRLCASMAHAVVLTSQCRLFGWGSCRIGQLGPMLSERKVCWTPEEIDVSASLSRIWKVAVGRDFTFVIDSEGCGLVYGKNAHFATALEDFEVLPNDRVYSGWSTVFIQRFESLIGFGRNNNAQLPPTGLPPIKELLFAAGSEHSIAVTGDSKVLAWGWGEHGNCGSPSADREDAQRGYNVLDVDMEEQRRVSFVGAGCATSFIAISDPE